MLLMRNTLEDNKISPEKLYASLGKFTTTMNQFVDVKFINKEVDYFLAKDVIEGTEGFMALLELCQLHQKAKRLKSENNEYDINI